MPRCEQCGNDYDKAFQVVMAGRSRTFDSFECAIEAVAPRCAHCRCRIIGHGMEKNGALFCCAHCAGHAGAPKCATAFDRASAGTEDSETNEEMR